MSILFPLRRALSSPFGIPLGIGKTAFVRVTSAAIYRKLRCNLFLYDDLTRIASKYLTDKGVTFFPFNGYTRQYRDLFDPLRFKPITVLEIGLARKRDRNDPRVTCPSLQLWSEYFPHANILGFDIDDFSMVHLPRTKIFRGDQGKPEDLLKVVAEFPQLHIVIDDGSHASFHQQTSLRTLWKYLAPGGIYAIEDLDVQPPELERSLPCRATTRDLLTDIPALNRIIDEVKSVRFFDSPLRSALETLGCLVKAA